MAYQLIDDNIVLLKSAIELLNSFNDSQYSMRQVNESKSGVGPHLRHVIDHYHCMLMGVIGDKIDYDHRERADTIESSVSRATEVMHELIAGLEGAKSFSKDKKFAVRMDCGTNNENDVQAWCESTLGRELQFLVSHTVHHFAIIDIYCQVMGISVPEGFGIAPSTLKYMQCSSINR